MKTNICDRLYKCMKTYETFKVVMKNILEGHSEYICDARLWYEDFGKIEKKEVIIIARMFGMDICISMEEDKIKKGERNVSVE